MFTRPTVFRSMLTAGLVAVAVAGCAQMRPSRMVDIYDATLTGSEEVPPVATSARGQGEFQLNRSTNTLRWKVTYGGLSGPATGGHVHGPAAPGQNAGVLVPFTGDLNAQPIQGEKQLTPQQVADLTAGRLYANIHSAAHPGGEIRGQLRLRR